MHSWEYSYSIGRMDSQCVLDMVWSFHTKAFVFKIVSLKRRPDNESRREGSKQEFDQLVLELWSRGRERERRKFFKLLQMCALFPT
jgi:hypothetical protein